MPKINVKFGSKTLSVDADLNEPPFLLKAQLFELTEVPPERQKLLIKGKTIGNDSWNGIALKEGATIMLLGNTGSTEAHSLSSTGNAESGGSSTKPVKQDEVVLPVGLKNLGNTCYMNATLQCFKVIPELDAAVKKYNPLGNAAGGAVERARMITAMLKKLYGDMDRMRTNQNPSGADTTPQITPIFFLHILHQTFPQFATLDERGQYQQQDANECFCEVLRMLIDEVKYSPTQQVQSAAEGENNKEIPLKKYFEIEYEVVTKCLKEGSNEEPQKSKETHTQLNCYLSQDVRYIQSGIKNKMKEEISKFSTALACEALYEKHSQISRLPAYLSVQIVRFYYKEKENVNAKILKDVKFPLVLDVFELCTPEFQEKLKPARQALKDYDDAKVELQRKAKLANPDDPKMDLKPKGYLPNTFEEDPGSNNSGIYELKALITHKGRASNAGHYVAWVRVADDDDASPESAKWAACDDDDIYPVTEEEILKLSGGGDWHCAYVLLYGPKKIPQL